MYSIDILRHSAIITERFRTGRNDTRARTGRIVIYKGL